MPAHIIQNDVILERNDSKCNLCSY